MVNVINVGKCDGEIADDVAIEDTKSRRRRCKNPPKRKEIMSDNEFKDCLKLHATEDHADEEAINIAHCSSEDELVLLLKTRYKHLRHSGTNQANVLMSRHNLGQ